MELRQREDRLILVLLRRSIKKKQIGAAVDPEGKKRMKFDAQPLKPLKRLQIETCTVNPIQSVQLVLKSKTEPVVGIVCIFGTHRRYLLKSPN